MKQYFSNVKIIILALALGLGLSYVQADWSAPLSAPTTCTSGNPGCDAPINVSGTAQIKTGDFTAGGLTLKKTTPTPDGYSHHSYISPTSTNAGALALTSVYAGFASLSGESWRWYVLDNGNTVQAGTATIAGGSPALGKVLTASNTLGESSWQTPATSASRPTVTYIDYPITNGASYTFPANAYAIMGHFNGVASTGNVGVSASAMVKYNFNGETSRWLGGVSVAENSSGVTTSSTIVPFTIFIPLGKTSVKFDFLLNTGNAQGQASIVNFVIQQLITT